MSIVDFDTSTWNDPWFQGLSEPGKLLFIYLWTNDHKSVSGLYVISKITIANETGITGKRMESTLKELLPKVMYDADNSTVFVINHVKRQFMRTGKMSPKIAAAIAKSLLILPEGHPFIGQFLNKYKGLSISYPYPIDTLSEGYVYPPGGGEGGGEGKEGEREGKKPDGFGEFWKEYPNKKSKGAAEKAWANIKPSEHLTGTILSAVRRAKTSKEWRKDKGQYIPHPSTWLNAKGWEDEYTFDENTSPETKSPTQPEAQWYKSSSGMWVTTTADGERIELTQQEFDARKKDREPSPAMAMIKDIAEGMGSTNVVQLVQHD